jgi:hypothetical protein
MKQEHKLIYSTLQAMWWMHAASNGHCQKRKVYHGLYGPELTADEKRDDAMETAQRHIALFEAVAEDIHRTKS